jgi:hypothetical protein
MSLGIHVVDYRTTTYWLRVASTPTILMKPTTIWEIHA